MSSFDHKCQSLQMKWPQFKVSVITFLSFVMCLDLTDPTCVITCMMLHILMGFGLQRSPIDLTRGIAKFVFPEDQMKTAQNMTRNLSIAIRSTMHRRTPASFVNSVSTRSIRISTITDMMSCGRLTVPQICVRSGHATGTNLDSYADQDNFIRSLPAGHVLASNPEDTDHVWIPDVSVLPLSWKPMLVEFHGHGVLSCFGVEEFLPGGELHCFGWKITAVALLKYCVFEKLYGENHSFVTHMRDLARKSKFAIPDTDLAHPISALEHVSDTLRQEFDRHNAHLAKPSSPNLLKRLDHQSSELTDLKKVFISEKKRRMEVEQVFISEMRKNGVDLKEQLMSIKNGLLHRLTHLENKLARSERENDVLKSPKRTSPRAHGGGYGGHPFREEAVDDTPQGVRYYGWMLLLCSTMSTSTHLAMELIRLILMMALRIIPLRLLHHPPLLLRLW